MFTLLKEKMDFGTLKKLAHPLVAAMLSLKTEDAMMAFLRDIMTEKELIEMVQRLEIATKLSQGISYQTIQEGTGASSTTVARVAKYLGGPYGGYRSVTE